MPVTSYYFKQSPYDIEIDESENLLFNGSAHFQSLSSDFQTIHLKNLRCQLLLIVLKTEWH